MDNPRVIVVGASLAGCRAALTLAQHGIPVLVLDKARFPRWKPCAGGVSRKARDLIPEELQHLFQVEIRGARLDLGGRCSTNLRSDRILGWMIHREQFDQAFFHYIGRHPRIETREGCAVKAVVERNGFVAVETEHGTFRAEIVIGADGVGGCVARHIAGFERPVIQGAYEEEVTRRDRDGEMDYIVFDLAAIGGGYGWVFPKRDHYSLGGYVYRAPGRSLKKKTASYRSAVMPEGDLIRAKGHGIPCGGGRTKLHGTCMLVAGDAAGLVDPLTGEGIYYALRSGQIAAECVIDYFQDKIPLSAYTRAVDHEIRSDFRIAHYLAHFIYRHPHLACHVLFRNELICRWFAGILTGEMRYRLLLWKLCTQIWRLPFTYTSRHQMIV